ncbi:helix-turn-helix domain-containing protein [Kribbella deserti]|uniref:Helix-turn-helix domain-containing protein n=1 Tax=Kribbella deserti TaxID=1926257 RepID=A0ABV6QIR4_9ACTN
MASLGDRVVGSVGEYLAEQRRHAQLTLRQLSDLAGVSNPYLSQIERGLRKPSADVLQQLAKALRISAETLYVRAGILDPDDDTDPATRRIDVVESVLLDPALNERQKRVLLDVYASFVRENEAGETPAPAAKPTPATKPAAAAKPEAAGKPAAGKKPAARKAAAKTPRQTVAAPKTGRTSPRV